MIFLRFTIAPILLLAAVSTQPACTSISEMLGFGYTRPEVTLAAIEVKNASLTEINMRVRLRVKNPNDFKLTLYRIDYKVDAIGLQLADGRYEKEFTVKPQGQGEVTMPLKINTQNAFKILKVMMEEPSEENKATIVGTANFDSPVGEIEYDFKDEKSLSKLAK